MRGSTDQRESSMSRKNSSPVKNDENDEEERKKLMEKRHDENQDNRHALPISIMFLTKDI